MASGAIKILNDGLITDTDGTTQTAFVATQDGPSVDSNITEVQLMSTASAESGNTSTITVDNTNTTNGAAAVSIITADVDTKSFVIQSFDTTSTTNDTVYIGHSGVTTSTGIVLLDGDSYTDNRWQGAVYAIMTTGDSVKLRIWVRK